MGTHKANGSIWSLDLVGAGAGTFSSAILSAQGYQQKQADKTYNLMLDENIDMLCLIMVRLSRSSFCSSVVTCATNSESDVLCYGGGGGSRRFIVVVVVVAVKIGAFVEDAGLGGERLMIGMDSGGIEEEA
uniref:Uncharacterized protein n=1 Tax=Tanacetum cinerariifolium TaxID=118510 RepID=A0A699KLD0_TANCI|nr:hypothetical protein [Tanacetum cinerariifolium]